MKKTLVLALLLLAAGQAWAEIDHLTERATILMLEDQRSLGDGQLVDLAKNHEDADIRQRAILALGRIADTSVTPDVIAALDDLDGKVRRMAAFSLGELQDTTAVVPLIDYLRQNKPHWEPIEALAKLNTFPAFQTLNGLLAQKNIDNRTTQQLLRVIWRFNNPAIIPLVTQYTESNNTDTRRMAAYCLVRLRDESGDSVLFDMLDDSDSYVRSLAIRGIVSIDNVSDIHQILDLLDDNDIQVQINTLRMLQRSGFEAILKPEPLVDLAQNGHPNVRILAIQLLGTAGDKSVLPYFAEFMAEQNIRLQQVTIQSWARIARVDALDFLVKYTTHPEWRIRDAVAEALDTIPGSRSTELLAKMLNDPNPTVQATIITALSERDEPNFRELLWKMASSNPEPIVRIISLGILAEQADSSAVINFIDKQYSDPNAIIDVDTRRQMVDILTEIGTDAAIETLRQFTDDERYIVRKEAARSLERLNDETIAVAPVDTERSLDEYEMLVKYYHDREVKVRLHTNRGMIELELFPDDALLTVHNFMTLAKQGYYDRMTFHRVVPNFVIQAGCPDGNGWGGPGYEIRDEINRYLFTRGTVGMALSGRDTGGSQFFITHSPQPHLDGGYTIFAHVTKGMDVVDNIVQYDLIESVEFVE